jgi:hypothetical protein
MNNEQGRTKDSSDMFGFSELGCPDRISLLNLMKCVVHDYRYRLPTE